MACPGFGKRVFAQNSENTSSGFYQAPYTERNSGSFGRQANLITAGYGFPNNSFDDKWNSGVGPLYLKYEYGIIDEVGLGVFLGGSGSSRKAPGYKNSAVSIGFDLVGYYHFNKFIPLKQLDVFVGAGVGFKTAHYKYSANSPVIQSKSFFKIDEILKAGARWYFTPGFGIYAEGGYGGLSYADVGITFRF